HSARTSVYKYRRSRPGSRKTTRSNPLPEHDGTPDFTEGQPARRIPLHGKILIGLFAGIILGLSANWLAASATGFRERVEWIVLNLAEPAGKIFLRLMFMVVLPLVFSALALAVVEIGDV